MNLKTKSDKFERRINIAGSFEMSKRKKQRQKGKLPVVTVAYYGPDDKTATKIAVGLVKEWGKGPAELKRW